MNLAEFAIKQRTFLLFFTVLAIITGMVSYFELGKLEDPTFTVKSAVVVTLYPGASAHEVETQVTDKVETQLQQMNTLWKLRSLSRPGMSMIFVDLKESLDSASLPQEWDLLRRKISDVKLTLPSTAQISIIQDEFSEVYGMLFSISAKGAEPEQLRLYAKELQRRFKTIDGIKKIELHGVQKRVVNISMPNERLAEYGLSTMQVVNQLSTQNLTFNAGSYKAGSESIRINQSSEFKSIDDIKNFTIKGGFGELGTGLIRLGDVADISYGYDEPALSMNRYNGKDAVTLAVSPVTGINVVSLGDQLNQTIADYQSTLPIGVEISTIAFQPEEVDKSIANFIQNVMESVLIVVAVLWIFMGAKSAAIVGFSLILTILLTLIYMYIGEIDLQRVSLGTFILALGMLVDNAIVITDMFTTKLNSGIEKTKAAVDSVEEIAMPLLGATIIAIMGASPVLFSHTDSAEFAGSLFKIMCSSLLLSWLVAMTITPLFCWLFIKPSNVKAEEKISKYQKVLSWTVENPKQTLAGLIPLILVTAIAIPNIAVNFMPSSDRAMIFLDYWLPNGAQIEKTSDDMKKIETWLLEQPEVDSIATFVGSSSPRFSVTVEPEPFDASYGQILVNTIDYESIQGLIARGDVWLSQTFPNAEPRFRSLKLATKDKFSIEGQFTGPDSEVLHQLAEQAKDILRANKNIKYVRDNWRQTSKTLVPVINQEKARKAGINRADIAFALKRDSEGVPLGSMNIEDEIIAIRIQGNKRNMDSMATLPVHSLIGVHTVPLGQVVDEFKLVHEESMIWRRNRVKEITVQAGVTGKTASDTRQEIVAAIEAIELPEGYNFAWGGEFYDENRTITDTIKQMPKAFVFMIVILVAMFNGFKQPVIILTTVPLAATGASFSLLLFDKPFGFMALIGAITLSGMIIKNGIVLMDQIELERKQGKSLKDAIKGATLNRTMAISMGALTTALGMIPLLSDRLFDQMAATIIGGLAAATILSLFIMPAMYQLFYRDTATTNDPTEPVPTSKTPGSAKELTHENS